MEETRNPFLAPNAGEPVVYETDETFAIPRPRIWTVFAVFIASFVATLGFSIVVVIVYLLPQLIATPNTPPDAAKLTEELTTPAGFLIQGIPAQLGLLIPAVIAALLSPIAFKERLGFRDSGLTFLQLIAAGLSSFVPAAFGMGLATLLTLVLPPDPSIANMYQAMTPAMAIPFILFIAFFPGFGEEMLFRGYMLQRLTQRWSPKAAILVTSILFAVIHIMPHTVVFAFPIGLWFGYMAWKTNSIWPCILGHIFVNGIWNILQTTRVLMGYSESLFYVFCGVLVAVGIAATAISWPAMIRLGK